MPVFIFRNFFLEALAVLKYAQRFSTQSSAIFDDKICANPMRTNSYFLLRKSLSVSARLTAL